MYRDTIGVQWGSISPARFHISDPLPGTVTNKIQSKIYVGQSNYFTSKNVISVHIDT